MLKKLKKILFEVDIFLLKLFRSHKSIKYLQNMKEVQILFSALNTAEEDNNVKSGL